MLRTALTVLNVWLSMAMYGCARVSNKRTQIKTNAHLASTQEAVGRQGVGIRGTLPTTHRLIAIATHEVCEAGAALEQPQSVRAAVLFPAIRTHR